MSDAISCLPDNNEFQQDFQYSSPFRIIFGNKLGKITDLLFLTACGVQACSGLVQTSKAIDGLFTAPYMLGHTFGIEIFPELTHPLAIIKWSPMECAEALHRVAELAAQQRLAPFEFVEQHQEHMLAVQEELSNDLNSVTTVSNPIEESLNDSCYPFESSGPMLLSVGFIVSCCLLFPLSRGNLSEIIVIQLIAVSCSIVCIARFVWEFSMNISTIDDLPDLPMFGTDTSNLIGVVLFNFGFPLTVPGWLREKNSSVSVNRTIWTGTSIAALVYIIFGSLAASAFKFVEPDFMTQLASREVSPITQTCATIFGLMIIGAGVPIYLVMLRKTLISSGICDENWAFFIGSVCPFLFSWLFYQGDTIITIINWSGIIVHGSVAFILPLVLSAEVFGSANRTLSSSMKAGCASLSLSEGSVLSLPLIFRHLRCRLSRGLLAFSVVLITTALLIRVFGIF
jgi:hypothetical protein